MTHPTDLYVGQQIRACRLLQQKTQEDLGKAIGVRFQQLQKYETGTNRVSASKLLSIADYLDTPIQDFFPTDRTKGITSQASDQEYRLIAKLRKLSEPKVAIVYALVSEIGK